MRAATATGASWDKITLTVDSGASDTVLPPHMLRWVDLVHTGKVSTECEVASGQVVRNFGEKRCLMRIGEKSQDELDVVVQVVEHVHKPLLAVISIVRQGHNVIFAEEDSHILSSSGGQIPVRYQNRTHG